MLIFQTIFTKAVHIHSFFRKLLWCTPFVVFMGFMIFGCGTQEDLFLTELDVLISDYVVNPLNSMQHDADVLMTVADGRLYFLQKHPSNTNSAFDAQFKNRLCTLEKETVRSIFEIDYHYIVGVCENYLYYSEVLENGNYTVICYDFLTGKGQLVQSPDGESLRLLDKQKVPLDHTYLFTRVTGGDNQYYPVKHGEVLEQISYTETYPLGSKKVSIICNDEYDAMIYLEGGETIVDLSEALGQGSPTRSFIPCDYGLLVFDSCADNSLYLVCNDSGAVVDLFPSTGLLHFGTLNVREEYAYLSLRRYEPSKLGTWPWEKADSWVGTYCINLMTFEIEKLNDQYYTGLYIFDDSGIFACDQDGSIYKLDFDGNVIMTILENR